MRSKFVSSRAPVAMAAVTALGLAAFIASAGLAPASADNSVRPTPANARPFSQTYTAKEIVAKGHGFFGSTTGGFAQAVEYAFKTKGHPNAYIVGEEASGAFVGGLRYGEGWLHPKTGGRYKVYWQGPSVGIDFGGNGSRVLVLVYNLKSINQIYHRFPGPEGQAYLVGGFGVNFQNDGYSSLSLAPIRTGIGARLGVNIGYLKYTKRPTWNPF